MIKQTSKWNLEIPNLEKPSISEKAPVWGALRIIVDIGEVLTSFVLPETIPAQLGLAIAGSSARTAISAEQGNLSASEAVIDYSLGFVPAFTLARKSRASLNKLNELTPAQIKSTFPKLYASQVKNIMQTADEELLKTIEKTYGVGATNRYINATIHKTLLNTQKTNALSSQFREGLAELSVSRQALPKMLKNASSRTSNLHLISGLNRLIREIAKHEELEVSLVARSLQRSENLPVRAFSRAGKIQSFNASAFHTFVQWVHFIDPKLAARKIQTKAFKTISNKLGLSQHGLLGELTKKAMRIDVFKFYKNYLLAKDNKLIPLNAKKGFTLAYRQMPMDPTGTTFMVVLYFNPLNTRTKAMPRGKEPVFLYPMTQLDIVKLEAGTGAYYLDNWAVTRGGRALNVFDNPIAARFLNQFRYGVMQDTFSLVHHTKKDIKELMSGELTSTWLEKFEDTSKRLISHKAGKLVAGRYGVAVARGFQTTRRVNGRTKTVYTTRFKASELETAVGIGARKYARIYESNYSKERRKQIRWAHQYHRVNTLFKI